MKDATRRKARIESGGSLEATLEARSLLKILALGHRQIEAGKTVLAAEAIQRLRSRTARGNKA